MISTAFLSMWISNTATTMMMVPIAFSIIIKLEELIDIHHLKKYTVGIFLGIAYSASIGGVATLVGTPPNLSFARILTILFPNAPEISFTTWMMYALPISTVFLFLVWLILRTFYPLKGEATLDPAVLQKEYKELGPSTYEEKVVFISFGALALLWIFRLDITVGVWVIPGWSRLLNYPAFINDGTVAIFISVLLFLIPSKQENNNILDWKTASKLPWHIVLLFGGGFALANGFKETGLANWLGSQLQVFGDWSTIFLVFCICMFVTFLTELTSNTATAEILLPIIGGLAVAIDINPLLLMIPTTVSCSFAFMLPVATPPNAIIFGTGRLKVQDMARIGVWINILGAMIISISILFLAQEVFNINVLSLPTWAIH
jgi:sodium-dependent dicarboxylate transporter 2/3/5